MSLLDRGNADVWIYHEVQDVTKDGNIRTRPSDSGVQARATIQLKAQSGTSARRSEQDNEGYEVEEVYRMRLTRASEAEVGPIGAQAQVEWRGVRWAIIGNPELYMGSPRTAHTDYVLRRN